MQQHIPENEKVLDRDRCFEIVQEKPLKNLKVLILTPNYTI